MARHGENIRKRKDGRWEGRYLVYSEEKKKKIYRSIYGKTYEEVREKLTIKKNLFSEASEEKSPDSMYSAQIRSKNIVLANVAQEWLAEIKEKRKTSTYTKYNLIYQNHIDTVFKDISLHDLSDNFVKEGISSSLSESVRKSIYCVLNQILKFASRQYSLTLLPLKLPVCEGYNRPAKVLAKKEQKKLISVLYSEMDIFKMAVLICLYTGLRLGELCALKWEDIDFENKILMIDRTVQRLYEEGHKTKTVLLETTPKSAYSHREIPLPDTIMELFAHFFHDKDYIFGTNKPLDPRSLQYHFKKILKEADLPNVNFHILRHTFSTNCIEDGTDVKSLSEMLGHSDVHITMNRYVHPSMDTKRKHMDSLSKFYGQIHGQAG